MENYQQEIREFTPSDMFSVGWNIFKTHFKNFAIATLIYGGVFTLLGVMIYYVADFSAADAWMIEKLDLFMDMLASSNPLLESTYAPMVDNMKATGAAMMISQSTINFGIFLFQFLFVFVIADMVEKCSRNEEPSLAAAFSRAGSKFLVGLLTYLMFWIVFSGLSMTIILLLPAVIVAVYWRFFLYAMILRDFSFVKSFIYSFGVVKNRWWIVFLYSIIFWLAMTLISVITTSLIGIAGASMPVFAIQIIASTLISAFFIVVEAVFFINFEANAKRRFTTERTN
jgi:hypothetical protein